MSSGEHPRLELEDDGFPGVELGCLYDDPLDPTELTIFVPDPSARTTAWITVDESTAISLEGHR